MSAPKKSSAQAIATKADPQQRKQYSLRLARSVKTAAKVMADREGISLNRFISLAVAEKVSRILQENSPSKPRTSKRG